MREQLAVSPLVWLPDRDVGVAADGTEYTGEFLAALDYAVPMRRPHAVITNLTT